MNYKRWVGVVLTIIGAVSDVGIFIDWGSKDWNIIQGSSDVTFGLMLALFLGTTTLLGGLLLIK